MLLLTLLQAQSPALVMAASVASDVSLLRTYLGEHPEQVRSLIGWNTTPLDSVVGIAVIQDNVHWSRMFRSPHCLYISCIGGLGCLVVQDLSRGAPGAD